MLAAGCRRPDRIAPASGRWPTRRSRRHAAVPRWPSESLDEAEGYLRYARWVPADRRRPSREVRARKAALQYWQGDFANVLPAQAEPVAAVDETNVELQLVVANAAFRAGLKDVTERRGAHVQALNEAANGYLTVLKNNTWHEDAAHNYEYVVRLRDEMAKGRRPPSAQPEQGTDLGESGAPSAATSTKGFEIYIPLEGEENRPRAASGQGQRKGTQRVIPRIVPRDDSASSRRRCCGCWRCRRRCVAALVLARRSPPRRRRGGCARARPAGARALQLRRRPGVLARRADCHRAVHRRASPSRRRASRCPHRASADIVILQDASASMYVSDVRPDRWRRSVQFLRTFAEALSWRGDRVALALFAQLAAPQVRLTKDPNSLFFFLDHLGDRSPFRLENLTTWDTNIEEGIRWGLNLIEKDEQLFGKSGNPKAFVVISDGQSWSGDVARALQTARQRDIPVFVVGIGTTVGGMIPEPANADGTRPPPKIHSALDRKSLMQIAVAGGGEYFEIGEESDRTIAFRIIDRLRRRAPEREAGGDVRGPLLALPAGGGHRPLPRRPVPPQAHRAGVAGGRRAGGGAADRQRHVDDLT